MGGGEGTVVQLKVGVRFSVMTENGGGATIFTYTFCVLIPKMSLF